MLEALATAVRQEKEIKGIPTGKEEINLFWSAGNRMIYVENPKESTGKILEPVSIFSKDTGHKIKTQKSITLLYTNKCVKTE